MDSYIVTDIYPVKGDTDLYHWCHLSKYFLLNLLLERKPYNYKFTTWRTHGEAYMQIMQPNKYAAGCS